MHLFSFVCCVGLGDLCFVVWFLFALFILCLILLELLFAYMFGL